MEWVVALSCYTALGWSKISNCSGLYIPNMSTLRSAHRLRARLRHACAMRTLSILLQLFSEGPFSIHPHCSWALITVYKAGVASSIRNLDSKRAILTSKFSHYNNTIRTCQTNKQPNKAIIRKETYFFVEPRKLFTKEYSYMNLNSNLQLPNNKNMFLFYYCIQIYKCYLW